MTENQELEILKDRLNEQEIYLEDMKYDVRQCESLIKDIKHQIKNLNKSKESEEILKFDQNN